MRKNEIINGYRIIQDFSCAGGGLSKWSFAERGGREYFIKEFLRPTYPLPDAPGSEKVKTRKRAACEKFEAHHRALMTAIGSKTTPGGNLISTLDFFRHEAKYYKVTEKVDVSSIKPAQIARLPLDQRLLIMVTTAHSLRILHGLDIVHGDLKIDNVLIKKTRMGSYTSKLIDFDDSYFNGRPPELAEDVVGDMVFYSPELARYIIRDPKTTPEDLTLKSDGFALGLLYSMYLKGRLPEFDKKYRYACIAVNKGQKLTFSDDKLPSELVAMINNLLDYEPEARPNIQGIFDTVKGILGSVKKKPVAPKNFMSNKASVNPGVKVSENSRLRGKLVSRISSAPPPPARKEPVTPKPRKEDLSGDKKGLKGTLLGKDDESA